MKKPASFTSRCIALIAGRGFFIGIVALLVVQASWIALSGRYPMAFDEDFHLGIIRLYAHHLLPFWSGQPAGADVYGAVARDPSYLYHYMMSFPYLLISSLTHNQTVQVLVLRSINIILFALSLIIARKLLLASRASKASVHACLLLFVLIPVVPLLAAQINYDNLLLPLTGFILLLVIRFSEALERNKRPNASRLIVIFALCLLTSLVKYAFLPIFMAVLLYMAWRLLRTFGSVKDVLAGIWSGIAIIQRRLAWLLIALLVVSSGLFMERYGVNLVRYHTPVPDCGQVLSARQCRAYGPWIRDYTLEEVEASNPQAAHTPLRFAGEWLYGMWLRLFFAVGGRASDYETRGPLLVPAVSAILFAGTAALLCIRYGRAIFLAYNRHALSLLSLVTSLYIGVLWLDEYRAYLRTGQPVAINGRYLLPVLLPIMLFGVLGVAQLLRGRAVLKLATVSLAGLSLLCGGGALTYILRSNPSWNWQSFGVPTVTRTVQHIVGPAVPGYRQPTQFLR